MNDDQLKENVALGSEADTFLSSAAFQNAKTQIRASLFNEFCNTKFKDSDERDEIWRKLQSLEFIENSIERVVRDGKLAHKTLLQRIKDIAA